MTGFSGSMQGTDNVRKSDGPGRNPGQGTGAVVQGFTGSGGGPEIAKTGAYNNGGSTANHAVAPRADGRVGSGPYHARKANA